MGKRGLESRERRRHYDDKDVGDGASTTTTTYNNNNECVELDATIEERNPNMMGRRSPGIIDTEKKEKKDIIKDTERGK